MNEDDITLKSGVVIYPNEGILGIGPELTVASGYDQIITFGVGEWRDEYDFCGMSKADLNEIADIAIERWTRLKAMLFEPS